MTINQSSDMHTSLNHPKKHENPTDIIDKKQTKRKSINQTKMALPNHCKKKTHTITNSHQQTYSGIPKNIQKKYQQIKTKIPKTNLNKQINRRCTKLQISKDSPHNQPTATKQETHNITLCSSGFVTTTDISDAQTMQQAQYNN